MKLRAILPGLAILLVILLAGCSKSGPELYRVRGVVTHQGKPVSKLYLVFRPDDLTKYAEAVAVTDDNGRFDLMIGSTTGVFPGPHTVIAEDPLAVQGAKSSEDPAYLAVCKKYSSAGSTLKITIDKNESNLQLKLD
jgi:hypothetical protein